MTSKAAKGTGAMSDKFEEMADEEIGMDGIVRMTPKELAEMLRRVDREAREECAKVCFDQAVHCYHEKIEGDSGNYWRDRESVYRDAAKRIEATITPEPPRHD